MYCCVVFFFLLFSTDVRFLSWCFRSGRQSSPRLVRCGLAKPRNFTENVIIAIVFIFHRESYRRRRRRRSLGIHRHRGGRLLSGRPWPETSPSIVFVLHNRRKTQSCNTFTRKIFPTPESNRRETFAVDSRSRLFTGFPLHRNRVL